MKIFTIIFFFILSALQCFSQVLSNTGSVINISSGTVVNGGSINNSSGTITNTGTLSLTSNYVNSATVNGNGNYNIGGNWSNSGTFTAGASTVSFDGAGSQNIGTTTFYNLTAATSGTKTATGALTINGVLTINSNVTLDMVTNAMSGTLTSSSGTGNFKTQNVSASPIPSGITWAGSVFYNSSSAQTIQQSNYNNLDGTGGNRTLSTSTIGIAGDFTVGAGAYTTIGSTINFNSGGAQNIPAFSFNNITVSGGNTKTVNGSVSLSGALTLSDNTTLALSSNNITLTSTATGTARVATIPSTASITYGTGKFIVQRYIQGRRKYRIITSPVTTHANATLTSGQEAFSIWGNWQTAGANTAGIGNIITGGTTADGFDQQTTTSSIYTYDDANRKFIGFTSANGKKTKYTPLKAGVPYYMFVYGDRTNSIISATPGNTTLTATGTLLVGDQTYNTASALPLSNVVGRYTMVGNPFASPIDWSSIVKTNIAATYLGWDPNLSSTGGYVTVTSTGTTTLISPYSGITGLNQYIQPGQGFFVQTTDVSPQMIIREQDKVSNFNANAFRTKSANDVPLLAVNLFYDNNGNKLLADGVLAAFDGNYSNNVSKEDAVKMPNAAENISIINGNEFLSIDARQLPGVNDTMHLNMLRLKKPSYTLQIFAQQMEAHYSTPYLEDVYLKTTKALSVVDTNWIDFTVDVTKAASFAADRFRIIYQKVIALPITFISVSVVQKDKNAQVQWNVQEDKSVRKYEIEHSEDNRGFSKKGEIVARANGSKELYEWLDIKPAQKNYYRIRSIHTDGSSYVSKAVLLQINVVQGEIKIFPNPVTTNVINVQLNSLEKADYKVILVDGKGAQVFTKTIYHPGGTAVQQLQLTSKLNKGIYYLHVIQPEVQYTQAVMVQ